MTESVLDVMKENIRKEKEHRASQKLRFFKLIDDGCKDNPERHEKLIQMYEDYGEVLTTAPASGVLHFHNCYPGGYLDHVLNVHDNALEMTKTLKKAGGWVDFSYSEMIMAALHHDLGKLGNPGGEHYYVVQDSEWHREKKNEYYTHNTKLQYISVTDRALFTLQRYNITLTEKEWLAIKLSDGMYDDSNAKYLKSYASQFPMHTNLPYVIHWSDHLSTTAERDPLKKEFLDVSEEEEAE